MKNFVYTDGANINVTFKVDVIGNANKCTIMEVTGLDTVAEVKLFNGFKKLPNEVSTMKKFAVDNNLTLNIYDNQGAGSKVTSNTSTSTTTTTTAAPTTTTTTTP